MAKVTRLIPIFCRECAQAGPVPPTIGFVVDASGAVYISSGNARFTDGWLQCEVCNYKMHFHVRRKTFQEASGEVKLPL